MAARSGSPGQDALSSARGSSLFFGRPSRASGGTCSAGSTGASSGRPAAGPGDPERVAQAAELIDQPGLQGVAPGPDPAPGDRLDLLDPPVPAGRHLGHEVVVDRVDRRREPRALFVRRIPAGPNTSRPGRPAATVPVVSPSRSSRSRTTNLPPNTPIEPVRVAGSATITSAGQAM